MSDERKDIIDAFGHLYELLNDANLDSTLSGIAPAFISLCDRDYFSNVEGAAKGCHGHNGPVETSNHKSLIEVIAVSPTAMALVPTAVCLLLVTLRLPRDADARSPRGMIHENAKAKNKKKREPTRLVLWKAQINTCKCKHFLSVVSKLNY